MSSTKGLLKLIESAKQELNGLKVDRDLLDRSIDVQKAKIEALESALKSVEASEKRSGDGERRMRMGAKKRLVFQLVKMGADDLRSVQRHLPDSFNPRYARAVVRDALEEGDMTGDLENEFELTPLGEELLEKAPIPKGWNLYDDVLDAAAAYFEAMQ